MGGKIRIGDSPDRGSFYIGLDYFTSVNSGSGTVVFPWAGVSGANNYCSYTSGTKLINILKAGKYQVRLLGHMNIAMSYDAGVSSQLTFRSSSFTMNKLLGRGFSGGGLLGSTNDFTMSQYFLPGGSGLSGSVGNIAANSAQTFNCRFYMESVFTFAAAETINLTYAHSGVTDDTVGITATLLLTPLTD